MDVLKAGVCVVMGHSQCGAVQAAVSAEVDGWQSSSENITALVELIRPAVKIARGRGGNLLEEAVAENVRLTWRSILEKSTLIRERVAAGELGLVRSVFDPSTGTASFEG